MYSKRLFVPVVIFDLDRTLTRRGSFFHFMLFCLWHRRWRLLLTPFLFGLSLLRVSGLISPKVWKERLLALSLVGLDARAIDALAEAFARKALAAGHKGRALQALDRHRRSGACLVLTTANMDFYGETLGRLLHFDHVIATPSCWTVEGHLMPEIGDDCSGAAKLRRVHELMCALPGEIVAVYTDDNSGLPLLLAVQDAISGQRCPPTIRLADQPRFPAWRPGRHP